MDEDLKTLKGAVKTLNRAYSDLVAYAIIAIHMYEEYLRDKATSKELAVAMTDLLKVLPTDFAGTRLKKPRKAPRTAPTALPRKKRPQARARKKDEQKGSSDE